MLVTVSDIELRLGRELTPAEEARILPLLSDVTAYIESYTGVHFEIGDYVKTLRVQRSQIDIPDRPVISVSAVKPIGPTGAPGAAVPYFNWDGLYTIRLGDSGNYVVNAPAWWDEHNVYAYQVTYSAGYATVPGDIAAVAGNAVVSAFTASGLAPSGVTALTVGDVAYRFGSSGLGQISASITDEDRDILNKYRVKAHTSFYRR